MIDVSLFFMFFVSYLGIGLMILIPVILIQRKIERWMKEDKRKIIRLMIKEEIRRSREEEE